MQDANRTRFSGPTRGFTLIEVLVVVAIIALLISILLPSLAGARRQARQTVCGSNLHQIGIALVLYQQSYKSFPAQAMINVDEASGQGQAFGLWSVPVHQAINKLIKTSFRDSSDSEKVRSAEVFYCPEVRENDRVGDILGTDQIDEKQPPYLHITYAYLGRLHKATNDPLELQNQMPNSRKEYVKDEPDGRKALMSDMNMFWGGAASSTGKARWRINHGPNWDDYVQGQAFKFHGSNLAYGDGHVEWKNPPKFPNEFRYSANHTDLRRVAQMVRDNDMWWW